MEGNLLSYTTYDTSGEISGQPHLWKNISNQINVKRNEIGNFLKMCLENVEYVRQYEIDLIKAVKRDHSPNSQIGMFENPCKNLDFDLMISLSERKQLDEALLTICYILPAQILGFYKSLEFGLNPDNPSVNQCNFKGRRRC